MFKYNLPIWSSTARGILFFNLKNMESNLYAPSCKFDTDGRLRLQVEFVAGETRQQVTLADSGISDEND